MNNLWVRHANVSHLKMQNISRSRQEQKSNNNKILNQIGMKQLSWWSMHGYNWWWSNLVPLPNNRTTRTINVGSLGTMRTRHVTADNMIYPNFSGSVSNMYHTCRYQQPVVNPFQHLDYSIDSRTCSVFIKCPPGKPLS